MDRIPITKEGYDRLKDELKQLVTVERPSIQRQIAEAREHGDLKENAEYHAAKEKQSFLEGRIQELNAKIPLMQVVDPKTNKSKTISFGATVSMENLDTGETSTYQVVGPDEADLQSGKISFLSPIAKALIGKQEGDEVTIRVPKGDIQVEITEVAYL